MILTLTEKATITNPYWLFTVMSEQCEETKSFLITDTSCDDVRFNEFTITESDTEDLDNETVSLKEGFYLYEVREQESDTNTDPSLSGDIVEVGRVNVYSVKTELPTYDSSNDIVVHE